MGQELICSLPLIDGLRRPALAVDGIGVWDGEGDMIFPGIGLCPRRPSREESGVSRCAAEPGLATESPSKDANAGVLSSTDEDFWPANFSVSRGSGVLLIPNLSLMRGFVSSMGSSGTTLFASARRRLKCACSLISLLHSLTLRRTTHL